MIWILAGNYEQARHYVRTELGNLHNSEWYALEEDTLRGRVIKPSDLIYHVGTWQRRSDLDSIMESIQLSALMGSGS